MKTKKVFALTMGVATFALAAYAGYRTNKAKAELSEVFVTLENVEALTRGESSGQYVNCYSSIHYKAGSKVVYCYSCSSMDDYTDDFLCIHSKCQK